MIGSGNVYVGVVDDDESLCRSLARLLRAAGMQPITYSSAEDYGTLRLFIGDIQIGRARPTARAICPY